MYSEKDIRTEKNYYFGAVRTSFTDEGIKTVLEKNSNFFTESQALSCQKLSVSYTVYYTNILVDIGEFTRWFSGIVWNLRIIGATTGWVEIDVWLISPVSEVVDSTTLQLQVRERERGGEV